MVARCCESFWPIHPDFAGMTCFDKFDRFSESAERVLPGAKCLETEQGTVGLSDSLSCVGKICARTHEWRL